MTDAEAAMLRALQQGYQGEAIFRPSNASRWLLPDGCIASAQLIGRMPKLPEKASKYAREGTTAHKLAEIVWNDPQGLTPVDFVGRSICIDDNNPADTHFVDEEMGNHIADHLAIIEGYAATPQTEVYIETKLTLASLDPSDPLLNECRGTGDTVAVNYAQQWIAVVDLKYGKHKEIPADSPQLKLYLLMALLQFGNGQPWRWGSTTIHQPRLPVPPRKEDDLLKHKIFDPAEIMDEFLGTTLESMYAALAPDPLFNPSKQNCDWCPAAALCPAATAAGLSGARGRWQDSYEPARLNDLRPPFPGMIKATAGQPRPAQTANGAIVLPLVTDLDPGEIADILYGLEMFTVWATGVKHRAVQLMELGTKIPGFALTPRTTRRRWKYPRDVLEQKLLALGLKVTQIYAEQQIHSPKQLEDRLPKLMKGLIEELWERPVGELTLVADDVSKPTVAFEPPSNLLQQSNTV